jgi:hypothetical protein
VRFSTPTSSVVLAALLLPGCVMVEEMDLTLRNVGGDVLFLEAGASSGVRIDLEVQVDDRWVPISDSLAALCTARCSVPGEVQCAQSEAEQPVVYALQSLNLVTRHLAAEWWMIDPERDCAKPAPMRGELQAIVCHDNEAMDSTTGSPLLEPNSSGLLGLTGGARLAEPFCEALSFDLRQSSATKFDVRAER